jgi:hypothetical protein
LDFFGARYFSSAQGRFTSADPKQFPHDITDPQSWNKYGYTRNNPMRYVDPDGEDWRDVAKGAFNGYTSDNQLGVGRAQGGNSDFRTGQAIGDAVATLQGTLQTLVGTGGEVLGLSLDATGAGAVAGVPINVVSAGVIAQGATTAIVAGANLANSFASTLEPGPHAGDSIPARGPQRDFTPDERAAVNQAGKDTGCHTCGTTDPGTKTGNFVPDHQPPTKLNPDQSPQRLYPQCKSCSNKQGGDVNAAKMKKPEDQ